MFFMSVVLTIFIVIKVLFVVAIETKNDKT